MSDVNDLKDFDNFYYYGKGDLSEEIKSEVLMTLMQQARTLFYDRAYDSSEIYKFENSPNTIVLNILIPYVVVTALGKRNQIVSDGNIGPDRRIAISQTLVRVETSKDTLNVTVQFILLSNFNEGSSVTATFAIGA